MDPRGIFLKREIVYNMALGQINPNPNSLGEVFPPLEFPSSSFPVDYLYPQQWSRRAGDPEVYKPVF